MTGMGCGDSFRVGIVATATWVAVGLVVSPAWGAPPQCHGLASTIVGTRGDDKLTGSAGRDVIAGLGGSDRVLGGGGDDVMCGGPGLDRISGNAGDDVLVGGTAEDVLAPGTGSDRIPAARSVSFDLVSYADAPSAIDADLAHGVVREANGSTDVVANLPWLVGTRHGDRFIGGPESSAVYAGPGDDVLRLGGGPDTASAGPGDDVMRGGANFDEYLPGTGNNLVVDKFGSSSVKTSIGSASRTVIRLGPRRDEVRAGAGTVVGSTGDGADFINVVDHAGDVDLATGAGADVLILGRSIDGRVAVRLGRGNDRLRSWNRIPRAVVEGGSGIDLLDIRLRGGVSLTLGPRGHITSPGSATVTQFENVRTGPGDDTIVGSDVANRIVAGPGDDSIDGRGDVDIGRAGLGDDTCVNVESASDCEH